MCFFDIAYSTFYTQLDNIVIPCMNPGFDPHGNPVSYFSDDSSSAATNSTDNGTNTSAGTQRSFGSNPDSNSASGSGSGSASSGQLVSTNNVAAGSGSARDLSTGSGLPQSTSCNFPQTESERSATLSYRPLPKSASDQLGKKW